MKRFSIWILLCVAAVSCARAQTVCDDAAGLKQTVDTLSAPVMDGRGPETAGLKASAEYIRKEFQKAGLKSGTADESYFQNFSYTPADSGKVVPLSNVVGVLEGKGPGLDTIVIGAHYDHLGFGPTFSMAQGEQRHMLHPGADDNASGIAVLLGLARCFGTDAMKLQKRIVFIAFAGEEEGELGSKFYVKHPLVPLTEIDVMINLDMVGRVRDNVIGIAGNRSGDTLDAVLDRAISKSKLTLMRGGESYPDDSDHGPFAAAGIPILYVCSGSHDDRHTPGDTADKINVAGMAEVAHLVKEIIETLMIAPRPQFLAAPK
jgi:Zn-dependent M28 family amino/carboxypeptidase